MTPSCVLIASDGTAMDLGECEKPPAIKVANALAGKSPQVRAVIRAITHLAHAPDVEAVIKGEIGVGKEIVGRCVHRADSRRGTRTVKLDASMLDDAGRKSFAWLDGAREAFSDVGGTLLLSRVDMLTPSAQAAVLALINGFRSRNSSDGASDHTVRILSLTSRDLDKCVKEGSFRADLFYRLATVKLTIPPLRARPEDIPVLANQFLAQMNQHIGKQIKGFSEAATKRMCAYRWPGNIRELRSAVERAAILTTADTVPAGNVMVGEPTDELLELNDDMTLAAMERRLILKMLRRTGGNRSRTARLLGINRGTLYNKLRQYRIRDKRKN